MGKDRIEQESSECDDLKTAYSAMVDVAEYANEYKRDKETAKIIEDVQVRLVAVIRAGTVSSNDTCRYG